MSKESDRAESLRRFSRASSVRADAAPLADEHTWNDLDMDAVCERIDHTVSMPGRMVLYRMLRSPALPEEALSARDTLIETLRPGRAPARALRGELARLGRVAGAEDLMSLLWEGPPEGLRHARAHRLLALVALACVPLALSVGGPAVLALILAFGLNAAVHFRTRPLWQREIQAFRFVGALRRCARGIAGIRDPLLEPHRCRLDAALDSTTPLARRVGLLSGGEIKDLLYEYVNILLLVELQAYQWIVRRWAGASSALREIFEVVGELDALASLGEWRADLTTWCRPDIETGPARLEIAEGVHPLLDEPVPSSLSLSDRGCLITGANMSGKSTVLRTLGVNALFAQTIFTCAARRFRCSPLRIISSMRVGDDILTGRSRYLAEAERLLELVRQGDSGEPALCLIDELLSGTNAPERLAASRSILDYLVDRGLLVVAATHDLELTESLRGRYDGYFLADDFTGGDVRFDHRLRPGVATARNAIRLLERLGYPEAIVAGARKRQPR